MYTYKSWLKSKTIRAGIVTFLAATVTTVFDIYKEKEITESHLLVLGSAVTGLYKVIEGRAEADTPIYTPEFLPGPNKPNVNEVLEEMATAASKKQIDDLLIENPITAKPTTIESKSNGEVSIDLRKEKAKSNYTITFIHDSVIKNQLADSTILDEEDLEKVYKGDSLDIFSYVKDVKNHIRIKVSENSSDFYLYIPHIVLINSSNKIVSLIDHVSDVKVETVNKTAFTIPGYPTTLYLEDPVIPGGHIYWSEITRNNQRPLDRAEQVGWVVNLCKKMEKVRSHFGNRPITITSAYRPPAVNRAVGGASSSQHLYFEGAALDFYIEGVSEYEIYDFIDPTWTGGLAIKPGHFCHIDNRPYIAGTPVPRWNY